MYTRPIDPARLISLSEEEILLEKIENHRHRWAIELSFATGARCQELRLLNIGDLRGDILLLPSLKAKDKDEDWRERNRKAQKGLERSDVREWRPFPGWAIIQQLWRFLAGERPSTDPLLVNYAHRRVSREYLSAIFRNAWKAGVEDGTLRPGCRLHDIRHTVISRLLARGVPLTTVARMVGHRSIQTTMSYTHVSMEEMQRAIQVLDHKSS
jgi:integrase